MHLFKWCLSLILLPALFSSVVHAAPAKTIAPTVSVAEAQDLGREAYVYFYSLISMELTRLQMTNHAPGTVPGMGPMNSFSHMRAFPDADFKLVVRPNFDTLYSTAWLDVAQEPIILSVPDTGGRYYLMLLLDMWSDVFAVPGKRTTGTAAGNYALALPSWHGKLPAGVKRIDAPTAHIWLLGRTQTNGPADYAAVHAIQDKLNITPLSQWGKKAGKPASFKANPHIDMKTPTLDQVNKMPPADYFKLAAELVKSNPPHITDFSQVARLERIGFVVGKSFDISKLDPAVRAAVEAGAKEGLANMYAKLPTLARIVNGWQMNTDTMGVYGDYYLKRAIVAMVGLGANQPEDAIYPLAVADADGKAFVGNKKYVWHFEKSQLPPVSAFWSLTMYDAAGFQVGNVINRFAIGDRDALKYNADGSLDIYIQATSPGAALESNWLPCPATGELGLTMRLYGPQETALDGRWNPPAIKRK